MKKRIKPGVLMMWAWLSLVVAGTSAFGAETVFKIDWFALDGGGGTSTGGVYRIEGTIGQPQAGAMAGANYSLVGGFWGIFAPQPPPIPQLSAALNSAEVIISWKLPADGWVLEQAPALAAIPVLTTWFQVDFPYQTNATHIFVTVPAPDGNKFYRLRKP